MTISDDLVKIPPYDLDAEEAVLGSLLIDTVSEVMVKLLPILKPEDFYREKNRWTYEACCDLHKRGDGINQITVAHELAQRQKLEAAGGAAYLSHLVAQCPTTVHAVHYAKLVADMSMKRRIISAANQIASIGYDGTPPTEAMTKAEQILLNLREGQYRTRVLSPTEQWQSAVSRYESLRAAPGAMFKFGLPWLDDRTGGARAGNFVLLGARPKIGKTTLLWQWAETASKSGNILFCSAEMTEGDLRDRVVASEAGMRIVDVASGMYSPEEYDSIYESVQAIPQSRIYLLSAGRMTTEMIRSEAMQLKIQKGLCGVFVDYVGRLLDQRNKSSYERMSYISSELKSIAVDLGVPLVSACQLNRAPEHGDKRPQLHELRDTGALEQDADLVLLLYRADAYAGFVDKDCPAGQALLILAAQRQGGDTGIKRLVWLSKTQKYGELSGEKE